jgi:hypothetical protein
VNTKPDPRSVIERPDPPPHSSKPGGCCTATEGGQSSSALSTEPASAGLGSLATGSAGSLQEDVSRIQDRLFSLYWAIVDLVVATRRLVTDGITRLLTRTEGDALLAKLTKRRSLAAESVGIARRWFEQRECRQ